MNFWNRSSKWLMTRMLAGILALTVLISATPSFAAADDGVPLRERMAKMIATQSGGQVQAKVSGRQITFEARRSAYTPTFRSMGGYARPRISIRVGGMLIGLPPESDGDGPPEALGIPDFDYEVLKAEKDEPTRVKMTFGTAAKETWSITVPAAVVTPMTVVAIDERPVLYTLTGKGGTVLAHPGIDNHRFVFRTAVLDLFADTRSSPSLKAEAVQTQGDLLLYAALVNLYNSPDDKGAKKAVEQAYQLRLILLGQAKDQRMASGSKERMRKLLVSLTNEKFVSAVDKSLYSLANLITPETAPQRLADAIAAAGQDRKFGKVEERKSSTMLSMVEERPWKLKPEHFKSPDVVKNPKASVLAIKYRIAYDGAEKLTDEDASKLYKELPISGLVQDSVAERLTPSDLLLLQEYNDAVIVHRLISSVFNKRVVNFPEEKWEQMIKELGDLYKEHLDVKTQDMRAKAELWQAGTLLHLQDREMISPPQLSTSLRLK